MQALRLVLGLLFISVINALVANSRSAFASSRIFQLKAKVQVGTTAEIPNGERKIVDTNAGAVIITNVNGGFYAVNAKCPHLGLPMKKGAIEVDGSGVPVITCNFHNSKFSMKDGSCKAWCTGVLGLPGTGMLAGAMGKLGGKDSSPATAYTVTEEGGNLFLDL